MTTDATGKPIVYLFSGQGAQSFQMGRELFERLPRLRRTMEELDAVVTEHTQRSVLERLYAPQARRGDLFDELLITHPAIFMLECALSDVLREEGIQAERVVGASLGEYAAAVTAGALDRDTALRSLIDQAQCFVDGPVTGTMIAVLANIELFARSAQLHDNASLAAINCESHFVLSCTSDASEAVEQYLCECEVPFQALPVRYPFHCEHVDAVREQLMEVVRQLPAQAPRLPVHSCSTARALEAFTVEHVWHVYREPIRLQETIQALEDQGSWHYVDLGPGGSFATLVKHNLAEHSNSQISAALSPFDKDWEALQSTLQRLG